MALYWSIARVRNWKRSPTTSDQRGITHAIVWATLVYDLGRVTEKNVDQWLFRQEFARRVDDFYPYYRGADRSTLTRAEFERRLGLETNVVTTSRPAFQRKLIDKLVREVSTAIKA
jgi:hypothetical protein